MNFFGFVLYNNAYSNTRRKSNRIPKAKRIDIPWKTGMSLTVGDLRFTSGTDVHRLAVNLDFQTSGRTKVECVNAGFTILKCFQFVSMLYYQKDVNCQTLFALYSTNIF